MLTRISSLLVLPRLLKLAAAATVVFELAAPSPALAKIKEGDAFPKGKMERLEGGAFDFAAHAGKVVVVDFWASWCEPCKIELPALNKLHKKLASKGLVIVGVNVDETRDDAKGFLKSHPVEFPIVYDGAKKELIGKVDVQTMPTSLIIDKTGKVRAIHRGYREGDAEKFEKEILALLK
jgi:thiol-disulfide isomerase/thioredoxin